jgi:homocysteine S-methyltransferase
VWLAVTVEDRDGTRLRSGEPVADLARVLKGRAAAVLVNCSAPEAMGAALDALRPLGLPFGAYANGFKRITEEFLKDNPTVDALEARPDMTPALYARHAQGWAAQGATIIGGCCETTPAHIAAVVEALREGAQASA